MTLHRLSVDSLAEEFDLVSDGDEVLLHGASGRVNLVVDRSVQFAASFCELSPLDPARPVFAVTGGATVSIRGISFEADAHMGPTQAGSFVDVRGGAAVALENSILAGGHFGVLAEDDSVVSVKRSAFKMHECTRSTLDRDRGFIPGCEDDLYVGLIARGAREVAVDEVSFSGGTSQCYLYDTEWAVVNRATFDGANVWTSLAGSDCKRVDLFDCRFEGASFGVEFEDIWHGSIAASSFVGIRRRAIEVSRGRRELPDQHIRVAANKIAMAPKGEQGIVVTRATGVTVTDNEIDGGWHGILIREGGEADIVGNRIDGSSESGLWLLGAGRTTVSDNAVTNTRPMMVDGIET